MIDLACLVAYQPGVGASTRYRVAQYRPLLRGHGIDTRMIAFATPRLQALLYRPGARLAKIVATIESLLRWLPRAIGRADGVIIQREAALIGPPLVERWLSRRYPLIFDFDDAIFLPHGTGVNGRLARWARPTGKTASLIRMSRVVLAGNGYLAQYARRFNARVEVLPTTVDCARFSPRSGGEAAGALRGGPVPTVGWIGSHSTAVFLEGIASSLAEVARTHRFRLLVVGAGRPIDVPGVECVNRPWSAEREAADFQELDIGLYPLQNNAWSLGKCGLKAIQYGAVGIPALCSPVGVNAEIVIDGATGLHAASAGDWAAGLRRLLDDAGLRARLGTAARERVLQRYALERHGPRLAAIIKETLCAESAAS